MRPISGIRGFRDISTTHHFNNRKVKSFREGVISIIVRRARKYRSCSITRQNVISYPNWHLFTVNRIDAIRTRKHTSFRCVSGRCRSITVTTICSVTTVFLNRCAVFRGCHLYHQRMFGGQNKIRASIQCIRTSRKDLNRLATSFYWEINSSAL